MAKAAQSMSDLARQWYRANKKGSPRECVEAMEQAGTPVSLSIAQQVKYKLKKAKSQAKAKGRKPIKVREHRRAKAAHHNRPVVASRNSIHTGTLDQLQEMKDFADNHGGVQGTRDLLDALETLRG